MANDIFAGGDERVGEVYMRHGQNGLRLFEPHMRRGRTVEEIIGFLLSKAPGNDSIHTCPDESLEPLVEFCDDIM